MQRDLEVVNVADRSDGIFRRGFAEIRKPDRIPLAHHDHKLAGGVGHRACARRAHHAHGCQRHRLRHIIYAAVHPHLAGNISAYRQQYNYN